MNVVGNILPKEEKHQKEQVELASRTHIVGLVPVLDLGNQRIKIKHSLFKDLRR